MKISLAQINYHIGNFESNTAKIVAAIEQAKTEGADLVVLAELAVSGYPPRDFLEFDDFIDRCYASVEEIVSHCQGIAAIVGSPTRREEIKGKDLHNSAIFLANGKIRAMAHKSLLPNYDIFDEYRYFESCRKFEVIEYMGKKIALTICEDIWDIGEDPLYTISPMDELIKQKPDLMINIAASPFDYEQAQTRKSVILANVEKYKLPLFYVNHVGAQTELLFDGGSLVASPKGFIFDELDYFVEDQKLYLLDDVLAADLAEGKDPGGITTDRTALIHDALVMGVKNYFGKLGFGRAILGLSGGIDSAVTMVIATRALGPENVRAVLLPSEFSSAHSIEDARKLAENLGAPYDVIPIRDAFKQMENTLKPLFGDLPFNIAEENIQARLRGLILMALSNKFGHILLNTSNKSEAAVGYSTLYGDMNGGISVLGDVYKTEVFRLARYMNKDGEVIPENTIVKPPSAELRPEQKDTDSLPEYDILDEILYQYIEKRKGPRELVQMGFEKTVVDRILKLVNTSEYKRYQTPPILRVSSKAFGMGRRMPIVGKYLS
ncbi:MAG: NAD+ synthase [Bacteroidales bacterium]|nr:NAD+ synthase [Bacteroidales bacterium]